ncbi:hypothetical protein DUD99_06305 [Salmonella enterica subsp. enterica]|uniref:Uncharacterized protein n=1 Tax=Salmonella enterica TaxID=28901 RepID=A0A5U7LPK6_SALER|nr:hypothetical protein [Salmonella enterica subsp. enterica]EAT2900272.1 hypothetical protein [Salmonella enterica]ECS6016422.1 hypothetical protein [Salmonella enterica subsp. enterica serovar Rough O:k:1,5]EDU3495251.1 hypothetical protein [Salmonella enterica subsp. enterica serovar Brazos]EDX2369012.1 hypothetical protein [Salmonella enterica subsp. enterica serovar Memphis]OXM31437.1 hypothetical protein NW10_12250 [Salmonella enterica subsp. enterica serovar Weslaco]
MWLSVGRIRLLRRHPTLLQPMMALRLSGQQTPYILRTKKAAFAACCINDAGLFAFVFQILKLRQTGRGRGG